MVVEQIYILMFFPKMNKRWTVVVFGKRALRTSPATASRNALFTVGRPWKARQPCPAFYSKSVNLLLSNFHIATPPHPSTYAHGLACTEECATCQLLREHYIACLYSDHRSGATARWSEGLADFHVQYNSWRWSAFPEWLPTTGFYTHQSCYVESN